ncbi:MAG TPA: hypothetical protein PKA64_04635 [Myxococcota bacterium]|nr:hypothetical protein [Myxococcota bacterium]HNC96286.1 hypothetical protein [Myxococcota bacterium]
MPDNTTNGHRGTRVSSPQLGDGAWNIHTWLPGDPPPTPAFAEDIQGTVSEIGDVFTWSVTAPEENTICKAEIFEVDDKARWLNAQQVEFKWYEDEQRTYPGCLLQYRMAAITTTVESWTDFAIEYKKDTASNWLGASWIHDLTDSLTDSHTWLILQSRVEGGSNFSTTPVGAMVRYVRSTSPPSVIEVIVYIDSEWDPGNSDRVQRVKMIRQNAGDLHYGKRHDDLISSIISSLGASTDVWVGVYAYTLQPNT